MRRHLTTVRLIVMLTAGTIAGVITGVFGKWEFAATVGWAVAALIYSVWMWAIIHGMNAEQTRAHASREDPGRGVGDLLMLLLSVASLASVVLILVEASRASGVVQVAIAALAVVSVALSWILLHTLYTLRYARLYYLDGTGVSFNQDEPPRYTDFAYLAFTLGMTYQVSDTSITTHAIRAAALRHALLSFVFGSVILATTINLVAGLGH